MTKLLDVVQATIAAVLMSLLFFILFVFALTDPLEKIARLDAEHVMVATPFSSQSDHA